MNLVIEHDLDFILNADIPRKEKFVLLDEVMALVLDYNTWNIHKSHNGIDQRKKIIRMAKNRQKKKIDALEEVLRRLLHPDLFTGEEEGSDSTVVELGHILDRWKSMDMVTTVDDYFDNKIQKKPNTDKIKAKLTEIHDKYNIPHKTDNIRNFLSTLSNL